MKVFITFRGSKHGMVFELGARSLFTGGTADPKATTASCLPPVIVVNWGCVGAANSIYMLDPNETYLSPFAQEGEQGLPIYREVLWAAVDSHEVKPIG